MTQQEFQCRIQGDIDARILELGMGCVVEAGAKISGVDDAADYVRLGDFCHISSGVKINAPRFEIGDYSKIDSEVTGRGKNPISIGRNCWIGQNVILDSSAGLRIDDNVGIGPYSQVWTHLQFGDIVEGCRFMSSKKVHIQKDVWFVSHCIVSPVVIGEKSMALAGSVITREMLPNHVYGGAPATDLTPKLGVQFKNSSVSQKYVRMCAIVDEFLAQQPKYKGKLVVVTSTRKRKEGVTYFDVSRRTYTKLRSEAEVNFLKANMPLVKFTPVE